MEYSCIYKIENTLNGSIYIGSTKKFISRKSLHIHQLKRNIHGNRHMQNDFNNHGADIFVFSILVKCPHEYLIKLEQWFIDNLNPQYNICKFANSTKGVIRTKEYVESMKKRLIGNKNKKGKKVNHEKLKNFRGENAGNGKLTSLQVREIREKYIPRKYSSYRLSKEYNISRQQINRIINKIDWKHE